MANFKNGQKIRKSKKNTFFLILIFTRNILFQQKKIPLCFSILGLRNLTRTLQSSPILRKKNLEKLKKSLFLFCFFEEKNISAKEKNI